MNDVLVYLGSDVKRVRCGLAEAGALDWAVDGQGASGIGHEDESRVLLRKRPQRCPGSEVLGQTLGDLRTRAFIAQGGSLELARTPENTQPFRFRHLLFAMSGSPPALGPRRAEIMAGLPDFLTRNVQGQSEAELVFHRFLTHLKDTAHLDWPVVDIEAGREALARVAGELDVWAAQDGEPPPRVAMSVVTSRVLLGASLGAPMWMRSTSGIDACAPCGHGVGWVGVAPRRVSHPDYRALWLRTGAAQAPEGFEAIPAGGFVGVDARWEVVRRPLR